MSRHVTDPLYLVRRRPLELVTPSNELLQIFDLKARTLLTDVNLGVALAADKCETELPVFVDRIKAIGVAA